MFLQKCRKLRCRGEIYLSSHVFYSSTGLCKSCPYGSDIEEGDQRTKTKVGNLGLNLELVLKENLPSLGLQQKHRARVSLARANRP